MLSQEQVFKHLTAPLQVFHEVNIQRQSKLYRLKELIKSAPVESGDFYFQVSVNSMEKMLDYAEITEQFFLEESKTMLIRLFAREKTNEPLTKDEPIVLQALATQSLLTVAGSITDFMSTRIMSFLYDSRVNFLSTNAVIDINPDITKDPSRIEFEEYTWIVRHKADKVGREAAALLRNAKAETETMSGSVKMPFVMARAIAGKMAANLMQVVDTALEVAWQKEQSIDWQTPLTGEACAIFAESTAAVVFCDAVANWINEID